MVCRGFCFKSCAEGGGANQFLDKFQGDLMACINETLRERVDCFMRAFCIEECEALFLKLEYVQIFIVLQQLLYEREQMAEGAKQRMLNLWRDIQENPLSREKVEREIYELLSLSDSLLSEDAKYQDLVGRLTEYVEQNFQTINNLDEIAKEFYISESYMRKLYKKETGKTLFDVLCDRKMDEAKRRLKNTSESVQSIALSIGYSKEYFTKKFKSCTGILPTQYRSEAIKSNLTINEADYLSRKSEF